MRMKKFINDPQNLVAELLEGMVLAFPDKVRLISRNILAAPCPKSQASATGNFGRKRTRARPEWICGQGNARLQRRRRYLRRPGAPRCLEAIRSACAGGESALLVVLNHAGDVLSANIAWRWLCVKAAKRDDDYHEDMPAARISRIAGPGWFLPGLQGCRRRGGAGCFSRCMSGDCAAHGTEYAFAGSSGQHGNPSSTGQPIFELGDDEMEIGMGQHGEAEPAACSSSPPMRLPNHAEHAAGRSRVKSGEEILVLVNGAELPP